MYFQNSVINKASNAARYVAAFLQTEEKAKNEWQM